MKNKDLHEAQNGSAALARTVSETLTHLGIFPYRKGHGLLKDSVLHYTALYQKGSTGELYRAVAALHHCTQKTLESNIRSAIKAAHNSGMLLRLNALIGTEVLDKGYVPSNLQFISILAQYCFYRCTPEKQDEQFEAP